MALPLDASLALSALLIWSAQVAILTTAATLAAMMVAHPKGRLALWQGLLAALTLLPAIEPWKAAPLSLLAPVAATTISLVAATAPPPATFHWPAEYWLRLIAIVAALRLAYTAAGLRRLQRYRSPARPIADPLPFADHSITWYVSDSVPGPVTYGWRYPVILLPSKTLDLPPDLREAIQCHELIHVRRGDWLWMVAETIVRNLLWFHPAIWFVTNRIQLSREQVVDREAIALLQNRDRYLDALVAVAHDQLRLDFATAPSFLRKRHLVARVHAVMEDVPMSRSRFVTAAAAACTILPMAAFAAMWLFPFVAQAQTIVDGPGVTVNPGGVLLHRAPVHFAGTAVSGTVTLEATLGSDGQVTDAHVTSGPEELRKEALSSVLEWHYQPGASREEISIQFAGPTTAAPAPLAATMPRPTAGPAGQGFPATVKSIDIIGLTPEAEQQLRSRLPIHEGESVSPSDIDTLKTALQAFDAHLSSTYFLRATPAGGNEIDLLVRTPARPQTAAAATPPPPAPGVQNVAPEVQRVSPAVQAAKVILAPKPAYPPIAKQARIQGAVTLQAVIGKDGAVQSLQVLSTQNPLLTNAAMDAVKQWVHQPTLLNGQPIEVATTVTVSFTLQD